MMDWWEEETEGPRYVERQIRFHIGRLVSEAATWTPSREEAAEIARWYGEHFRDFACPVSERGWDWWEIDWVGVLDRFPVVLAEACDVCGRRENERQRAREAAQYPTLDAWLVALHGGEITSRAPKLEKSSWSLLGDHQAPSPPKSPG